LDKEAGGRSSAAEELAEGVLDAVGQGGFGGALALLKGAELDQADGGRKLGLVEGI